MKSQWLKESRQENQSMCENIEIFFSTELVWSKFLSLNIGSTPIKYGQMRKVGKRGQDFGDSSEAVRAV